MTLTKVMELALARAGLNTSAAVFLNRARDYFNMGIKEVSAMKQWRWLLKEGTLTTTSGTATYNLAADVMKPLSFRNVTDDFEMRIVDVLQLNRIDPDDDLSSGPENVAVVEWDTTNSPWKVRLWPTPDTNSESIKYQYYAYIDDFTSSNDGTELDTLRIPNWLQTSMVYYVAAHYMSEKGDYEGHAGDIQTFRTQVAFYADSDSLVDGAMGSLTKLNRSDAFGLGGFQFKVQDGSLTT